MEISDKLIGEIERRFESPTFILFYSKVEDVLRKAATVENTSTAALGEKIITHFGDDLEETELRTKLSMLKNTMQGMIFSIDCFKEKLTPYQTLFLQISKLFRLLLIMPATSATSERSFSSLRHIKTYLRTSMKQERLNHLMMIYVHKDKKIDFTESMKEFVLSKDNRLGIFLESFNIMIMSHYLVSVHNLLLFM